MTSPSLTGFCEPWRPDGEDLAGSFQVGHTMNMRFKENIRLAPISSFKVGGEARFFAEPANIEELKGALEEAKRQDMRFYIIGGGTNILWSDDAFEGVIIRPRFLDIEVKGTVIAAGSGAAMARVVSRATEHSLSGLEWAGGLPGTVGGAVRGNAGAFKGETKDGVREVVSMDTATYEVRRRTNEECRFGYRDSIFKHAGSSEIIIEATLALEKGERDEIAAGVERNMDFRRTRHPLEFPTAGSTFKNVPTGLFKEEVRASLSHIVKDDPFPIVPAGYLIEHAGMKGFRVGGAMISEKHSNFIVNVDHATARDIKDLIARVKEKVHATFGVMLEEEIIVM